MESIQTFRRELESDSLRSSKKIVLDDIIQEYCLKRNRFDPKKPSPNRFVNKLQLRMKQYYNNFSQLSSSPSKY